VLASVNTVTLIKPMLICILVGSCGNKTDSYSIMEYNDAHPTHGFSEEYCGKNSDDDSLSEYSDAHPSNGDRPFRGLLWKLNGR
jgi:hypothetical protein